MALSMPGLVIVPALLWIVVSDLLYRRIANRVVIALLLLWAGYTGWTFLSDATGARWEETASALLIAAVVLVLGYILFTMRWMGAGDAKLMATLCLWLGEDALTFLMVTALAGGVLALGMPLLRQAERALALVLVRLARWLPQGTLPLPVVLREDAPAGIPYGVAIACGAAFVLWNG